MIIIECNNDKQMIYRMNFTERQIIHAGSKGKVLEQLENERKPSIGVVDEDNPANKSETIRNYIKAKEKRTATKKSITLMKKKDDKGKTLIVISPRLEVWIYVIARRNKLSLNKYDLPDDPDILHNDTSKQTSKKFQNLLIDIAKIGDWEFTLMKQWITETIQQ